MALLTNEKEYPELTYMNIQGLVVWYNWYLEFQTVSLINAKHITNAFLPCSYVKSHFVVNFEHEENIFPYKWSDKILQATAENLLIIKAFASALLYEAT